MIFTFLVVLGALAASAQDFSPVPVSEYAEKSGPNTITFLSYPKYYQDHSGQLTLVDTTFVPSKDTEWDFEVTTGIWSLRVRTDGTFQAEHAGDSFTYRLDKIGVGRGDAFRALDLGEANWKNFQVVGDTIRWYDVFCDVDLAVRYIHDILKVDVIVKAKLMSEIRAEVKSGTWDGDDYLTARFEIPNVWVTTEARQNGQSCDLYTEALDIRQPLEFVKDDKVLHKLRPVETYVLDAKGEPIIPFEEENRIRCAQVWQLKKDAPGIAEMSANLGDLAQAEEGDVVMDPSCSFSSSDRDTLLVSGSGPYGSNGIVNWSNDERLLFGFDVNALPFGAYVLSSSLQYKIYQNRTSNEAAFTGFLVTTNWIETTAIWNSPWSNNGGDYDSNIATNNIVVPYDYEGWVSVDISTILNSHLNNDENDVKTKGILLKRNLSYDTSSLRIYMKEAMSGEDRPKLDVTYIAPPEQIWVLDYPDGPEISLNHTEQMPIFDCAIVWNPSYEGVTYHVKMYSSTEASHNLNNPDTWYHIDSIPGGAYNAVWYWDEDMIVDSGSSIKIAIKAQVNPETIYSKKPIDNNTFFQITKQKWSIIGEEIEDALSSPSHLVQIATLLYQRNYSNWLPTQGNYSPGTNLRAIDLLIACQNPGFKVFYTFCHGGVTNGYPRGIILESPTGTPFLVEPSLIHTLMTGTLYQQKLNRRLIFFNACNLASDYNNNYQILRDYMMELEAFGSGTWGLGAMVGYATQISNSVARNFATNFFTRLVNYPSNSMNNSFNWAVNQTSGISQAQPTLQGAINTVFENSTLGY